MSGQTAPRDVSVAGPSSLPPASGQRARHFISVGSKLASATIALMLAVAATMYMRLSQYQRESLLRAKGEAAAPVSQLFADSCTAAVIFNDDAAVGEALTTLSRNEDVTYAAVFSTSASGQLGHRLGELARGRSAEVTFAPQIAELRREGDRLVVVSPIRAPSRDLVGVALIAFSLARENAAIAEVERQTLWVSAGVAAVLTVLLLGIARITIVRPLAKLMLAANRIESGESIEIDVRSNDEIGRLASALRSMARAIRLRQDRINTRNRDMRLVLDNVGQGFMTLDIDGRISQERSRVVDDWFGSPDERGRFWDYLARIDSETAAWFELGWASLQEGFLPIDLCLKQLPALIRHRGHDFELAYRSILKGDQLDGVVVIITDATSRVERERAEQGQRESMSIFQHLLADRAAFEEFFEEGSMLVESVETFHGRDLTPLKRDVHTLKGNCSLYGIESVARFCNDLETQMEDAQEIDDKPKRTLRALWSNVDRLRTQFSDSSGIVVDRQEFQALLGDLRGTADRITLAQRLASWQFEPAQKRLVLLREQIQHLAKRLGKGAIRVEFEPTSLRLPAKKWGLFWSVFSHAIRNAVDHGIELDVDRLAAGKASPPTIALSIGREGKEVVVSIGDNGRGIDWDRIAEKARSLGLPSASRSDLEAALFADGLSSLSEATESSGRGVGLAAVRDAMMDLGGRIVIETQKGTGTTFRFFLPEAMLREPMTSVPPRSREAAASIF